MCEINLVFNYFMYNLSVIKLQITDFHLYLLNSLSDLYIIFGTMRETFAVKKNEVSFKKVHKLPSSEDTQKILSKENKFYRLQLICNCYLINKHILYNCNN